MNEVGIGVANDNRRLVCLMICRASNLNGNPIYATYVTPTPSPVVNCTAQITMWLTWSNYTVATGLGANTGQNLMVFWTDAAQRPVTNLTIYSNGAANWTIPGEYLTTCMFCCDKPTMSHNLYVLLQQANYISQPVCSVIMGQLYLTTWI